MMSLSLRQGLSLCLLLGVILISGCSDLQSPPEETTVPAPANGTVSLPEPRLESGMSVEEALQDRRSIRSYADDPLTLAEAGQLLWAAQGVTDALGHRTAPSAGALYPLEVYLVAGAITGLEQGVYRYEPESHRLVLTASGDFRGVLQEAALDQDAVGDAPADIVIAAVPERTSSKYGDRAMRYVYLEGGGAAQNIYLQAEALDLGTVTIGAFDDAAVQRVLALPANTTPLSIMPVGRVG
jgi:SagB-type dehydrogenase family enzyme